jgi:hypothetical protein
MFGFYNKTEKALAKIKSYRIKLICIVVKSNEKVFGNPSSLFPIIIIDLNK